MALLHSSEFPQNSNAALANWTCLNSGLEEPIYDTQLYQLEPVCLVYYYCSTYDMIWLEFTFGCVTELWNVDVGHDGAENFFEFCVNWNFYEIPTSLEGVFSLVTWFPW